MMVYDFGKRFALLAVLAAGLSACSALGTSVADDDPETEVPNTSMGRALMEGLGAVPSRQQAIKYTPRAPLVVPPSTKALAPPETGDQVASLAGWPDDPDVATQRRLREAAAREAGREDKDLIPSSELLAVRVPESQVRTGPKTTDDFEKDNKPLLPHQFAGMKSTGIDATGVYDANGKPRRRALVEPPVAYLEPAPGVPVTTEEPEKPASPPLWKRLKFW